MRPNSRNSAHPSSQTLLLPDLHITLSTPLSLSLPSLPLSPNKILMHLARVLIIPDCRHQILLTRHLLHPLHPQIRDLGLVIGSRIVVLAGASHALPQREMARVHGCAVVFVGAVVADVEEAAFLFFEIETGGVGEED